MDEETLNNLKRLMAALNPKSMTQDDFLAAVEKIVEHSKQTKELTQNQLKELGDLYTQAIKEIDSAKSSAVDEVKNKILLSLESELSVFNQTAKEKLDAMQEKVDALKDGDSAKPEDVVPLVLSKLNLPEQKEVILDGGEEIIGKINDLPTDNDEFKIDASHIKNLPKPSTDFQGRNVGGHGALYTLSDVDLSGITAGQSIQWDGFRWIPYTPSGGTGLTDVFGEVVSVTGTSFMLAHTPSAGTVRLYRGGAYQQAGVGNDYTLSGATGTLTQATNGEIFMADYKY